jgi:flagellin
MSLGVLNNISAIYAQNNLSNTQASLSKTLQQLSSGSRINSGADDAAGLSLANGLQASATALSQSAKNASEGVDFLQVADGALSQVTSLLNRAVTLATEASNGTLNGSQVGAADAEYQKILGEISTINNSTEYNGITVFGASTYSSASTSNVVTTDGGGLSVKFNDGTSHSFAAAALTGNLAADAGVINTYATANGKLTSAAVQNGQLVITAGSASGNLVESLQTATTAMTSLTTSSNGGSLTFTPKAATADTLQVTVNGSTSNVTFGTGTLQQLASAINAAASQTVASVSGNVLTMATGSSFALQAVGDTLTQTSAVSATNNKSVGIFTSDGTLSTSYNNTASDVVTTSAAALGLSGTSLSSTLGAQSALTAINGAIMSVASDRGTVGANINTLTAVGNVMTTQSTNTLAAQNDVTATDYGQATSDMSKFQILSQTGIAALSQANQSQQLITKLLQ